MKKICIKCKDELELENFSKKGKKRDGSQRYQSECKKCTKIYKDLHYKNNKNYYIKKSILYRKDFYKIFVEMKKELSCSICGENRYWVLDFHHLDRSKKDMAVSRMVGSCSKRKLKEEIEKCIVLCANCHRNLHHQEKMALSTNG